MDIFKDIIPSILNGEYLEPDDKLYVPYVINKALSGHMDCLYHANQMNLYHNLDRKMQYDYLFHSIRKYRRPFQKWHKKIEHSDLFLVKEYYGYSTRKAREVLELLDTKQLDYIREKLEKGGKNVENSRNINT